MCIKVDNVPKFAICNKIPHLHFSLDTMQANSENVTNIVSNPGCYTT